MDNYEDVSIYRTGFGDNDWVAVGWGGELSEDGERMICNIKLVDSQGNEKLRLDKKYARVDRFVKIK